MEATTNDQYLCFTCGTPPEEVEDREVKKSACPRARKLLQEFYDAKISLDTTFPYWYTRTWIKEEGQHPLVRRGLAMKSAFSHLEAAIRPDEILVMSRNKYVRGASITPWTANEFPLSDEERAKKDSKKASNKALEEITILATGGGVVSESTPEVLSMARRYGMRVEEHAALIEICRYWQNKSAEDTCWKWGTLHPEYDTLVNFKNAVLMAADMEYGNRHGRSVTNYQIVFEKGFQGMIDRCKELIAANVGDGTAVDKVAYWQATIYAIEGVQIWVRKYAAEATRLASLEKDA
ncbi:pyruvate formate lyase family protein, partial [Faecalicatena contorta]